jgi:hypothetical protein
MRTAVERSLANEQGFLDLMLEIARRMDPDVDADDAPRLVGAADPARLDAVLASAGLWARLWPHVRREPIVAGLHDHARRRFCQTVAAAGRSNTSRRRRPAADPVVRRAIEVLEAHRTLAGGFGRVALAVAPRRVFTELNLPVDKTVYEVLVILFSAHTTRRTIYELPYLAADVGLPTPAWLPSPPFDSGWPIAARIETRSPCCRTCSGACRPGRRHRPTRRPPTRR